MDSHIKNSNNDIYNINNNNLSTDVLLPSIYIHNIRSLNQMKFSELKLISDAYDMMFLTETWLDQHKERSFTLDNFVLHTCHRRRRRCGGVAIYVRNTLKVTKISEYTDEKISAYWCRLIQPNFCPIIYGIIYHPPGLTKHEKDFTIGHIISSMSAFISRWNNAKFFICGDFNDLDTSDIKSAFPLDQLVDFPTRGDSFLDLVFSDVHEYISIGCCQESPILNNDHCAISISSPSRVTASKYKTLSKHLVSHNAKSKITRELIDHCWSDIYLEQDVNAKVDMFQMYIKDLFCKHCPLRKVRVPVGKACLTTPLIRKLARAKKRAHKKGNLSWKYLGKILSIQLQKCLSHQTDKTINKATSGTKAWWKEVKILAGTSKTDSTKHSMPINMNGDWLDKVKFADQMNQFYLQLHQSCDVSFPDISNISSNYDELDISVVMAYGLS